MSIRSRVSITGFIPYGEQFIFLSDVLGIYADRGTPRKPGHWVKIRSSSSAKGFVKMYCEGLTIEQRRLIEAAGRFNCVVDGMDKGGVMKLYYFEIAGDRFVGEYSYDKPVAMLSFCNAKFFSSKKSAKIWRDRYYDLDQEPVLVSFECFGWERCE